MKAIVYEKYGSPNVLKFKEVEKPTPKDDEILIKIYSASVNAADWHYLWGKPFFMRFVAGLLSPKDKILGGDIAGIVEAVGKNVKQFKSGDRVYGEVANDGWGGFAEYVCVDENIPIVSFPEGVSFKQAAAVPIAGVTALQGLRDNGHIKPGQRVLINGASGGVGTFAIQLAKYFGSEVTAVCSTNKLDFARSLGADSAIDYTNSDFIKTDQRYDLIFDNAGNRSVADLKQILSPQGKCVISGYASLIKLMNHALLGPLNSSRGGKQIKLMGEVKTNKKDLEYMAELLEAGKVKSAIEKEFPLSETAEAIRYVDEGHAKGKVVINVQTN